MAESGNSALINALKQLGIHCFAGVNGGGIIHITKYLAPIQESQVLGDDVPKMFTLSEYAAGFMPIGYYLASGKIGGCIATTGAAIKLASSGLSEAKLSNIPAVYLFALNSSFSIGRAPLQDVSIYGMNIIPQLQAELADGCIVIEDISQLESQLEHAQKILNKSRPIAIAFYPDVLSQSIDLKVSKISKKETSDGGDLETFLAKFPQQVLNRRVVLWVCSEAARYNNIKTLTTLFSNLLQAPTVWSVNGANAVAADNPFGYGYISFGGNDKALELWQSLNEQDIVIALGFDPGEYSLNLANITAGVVWHFTDMPYAYGNIEGNVRHRISGEYYMVRGSLSHNLETIINTFKTRNISLQMQPGSRLNDLNYKKTSEYQVKADCVDLIEFYKALNQSWQLHSIGFDDVCLAYKDRQYVTERPNPNINFYSLQDGSAMGASLGLGVGAKLAVPSLHTFIFTGNGCWRLFSGNLADVRNLDLRLFVFNNQNYAIVQQALNVIIPEIERDHYHSVLPNIDFVAVAKAHGWEAFKLAPNLVNLKEIMHLCYTTRGRSILIEVPVDPQQEVGPNPRLKNIMMSTYL